MLSDFLKDYLPIIIFLVLALGLSCAFVVVNFILSPKKPDPEKLSAYECGFEPFEDARNEFNVSFYVVAILFLIFDVEVIYLFPWCLVLNYIGIYGIWAMIGFIVLLAIGFLYEIIKGALSWP